MCGIAGKIDFDGPVDPDLVAQMCTVMHHRGPDSRGTFFAENVGLGMQRLAIIDVSGGDQPIFNENRSVAVVLNGEIYNFRQLREELIGRGHRFATRTDTEVLVHLYEDHGEDLVHRLRGMFAFAIWDARRRTLLLARDRVGKKPLFWARHGSRTWFGSEVVALLQDPALSREVSLEAIEAYLAFQYVPHPLSAFRDIEKLPPASTLTVSETGEKVTRYWSLDYSRKLDAPREELEEELREKLRESTRCRLVSEVPLGAFLSGGVDSSAVVAAMAETMSEPVKTFSIGFTDEDFDELPYARMVAERFGTEHHEFRVEPEALSILPKLARHYGEPFADPSAIPSFYLAELTSRHVTVALNGDGGDESFAGYRRYVGNDMASHFNWLPRFVQEAAPKFVRMLGEGRHSNSTRTRIQRLARSLAMTPPERYAMWMSAFDHNRRQQLLTTEFRAGIDGGRPDSLLESAWAESTAEHRIEQMLDTDVNTYLPANLLVKMDIATMAYSVEARSPFLDHELMEFAAALPVEEKFRAMAGKRLLKSAFRGILPDEILDRPKMGFGVPLARWFRGELRSLPGEVLLDPSALGRGYFRREAVEDLIREHHQNVADHSLRLWVLIQLEMWHHEVVSRPPTPPELVGSSA